MRIVIIFLFLIGLLKAQDCNTCNIHVNDSDFSTYTVSTGQTLCIDSAGSVFGKIVLSGGLICNKGFLNPSEISILSGTIINSGNITLSSSLITSSGTSITVLESSVINVAGEFINNGSSITNLGFINISGSISNNGGSFINNNVINCSHVSSGSITNNSVINTN